MMRSRIWVALVFCCIGGSSAMAVTYDRELGPPGGWGSSPGNGGGSGPGYAGGPGPSPGGGPGPGYGGGPGPGPVYGGGPGPGYGGGPGPGYGGPKGAPGPIAGAGLPVLLVVGAVVYVRRRLAKAPKGGLR